MAQAVVSCALVVMLLAGVHGHALAATSAGNASGLKIAPVRTDITIDPGTSQTVSLSVQNVTRTAVTLGSVVNDFVASADETGEPRLVLNDSELVSGNNFQTLIAPIPSFTLAAGASRTVSITLSVPATAASGGYYGAVRFAPVSDITDSDVALSGSVGTIFLVTVPGNLSEKLTVASFDIVHDGQTSSLFTSGPLSVETRFQNEGNIHVQPFGNIYIKDLSGKIVQQIALNDTQPRGSVLPDSIRRFDDPITAKHMFGRYTIEGSFGYGTTGQLLLAKSTFYVIPVKPILITLAIILVLLIAIPRIIRTYRLQHPPQPTQKPQPTKPPKAKP
jgi:hypothetical protein